MKEILTYEKFFTNLRDKFFNNKSLLDKDETDNIKKLLIDGFVELIDDGFSVDFKDYKSGTHLDNDHHMADNENDEKSIVVLTVIHKPNFRNFNVNVVKDEVLTTIDVVKSNFDIDFVILVDRDDNIPLQLSYEEFEKLSRLTTEVKILFYL